MNAVEIGQSFSTPRLPSLAALRTPVEPLEGRTFLATDIGVVDVTTTDFTTIHVQYVITGEDSPPFTLRAFLSGDASFDPGVDQPLPGQQSIAAPEDLAAQQPHAADLTLAARARLTDVLRFIIVVADPDGTVEAAGDASRVNNVLFAVPLFAIGQTADRTGGPSPLEAIPTASGAFTGAILRGTTDFARLVDIGDVWAPPPQFQFAFNGGETEQWQRDEDRLVQPSVVGPLRNLVTLLHLDLQRVSGTWGDVTLSINDAYDSLRHHLIPESLHYEGRALDLDARGRPNDGPELARLAGLAWLAGFDWIQHEGSHIHVSERASFPTTIDESSFQRSVRDALRLKRITSAPAAALMVRTVDGLDAALRRGDFLQAVVQLALFRTEIVTFRGREIADTGFADLLLLNVDKLFQPLLAGFLATQSG